MAEQLTVESKTEAPRVVERKHDNAEHARKWAVAVCSSASTNGDAAHASE
jgi:hypothetical protein